MTATKEPTDQAHLAARLARAYPALSPYSAASLAVELCRIERAQRRHAERCCSGEDGGYVKCIETKDALADYHATLCGLIGEDSAHKAIAFCECETAVKFRAAKSGEYLRAGRILRQHDPEAEERAGKRIELALLRWKDAVRDRCNVAEDPVSRRQWAYHDSPRTELQGDPRGPVLLVRLPGEREAQSV